MTPRLSSLVLALAALFLAPAAAAQEPVADRAPEIRTGNDPATGARWADSQSAGQPQPLRRCLSNCVPGALQVWVSAQRASDGSVRVALSGERVEFRLRDEFNAEADPSGPGVRASRAYVGKPWTPASFIYLDRRTDCPQGDDWCSRAQTFQIPLDRDVVARILSGAEGPEVRVALAVTGAKRTDWLLPATELEATLAALDALSGFR